LMAAFQGSLARHVGIGFTRAVCIRYHTFYHYGEAKASLPL
jgi:hypothetical protein